MMSAPVSYSVGTFPLIVTECWASPNVTVSVSEHAFHASHASHDALPSAALPSAPAVLSVRFVQTTATISNTPQRLESGAVEGRARSVVGIGRSLRRYKRAGFCHQFFTLSNVDYVHLGLLQGDACHLS